MPRSVAGVMTSQVRILFRKQMARVATVFGGSRAKSYCGEPKFSLIKMANFGKQFAILKLFRTSRLAQFLQALLRASNERSQIFFPEFDFFLPE